MRMQATTLFFSFLFLTLLASRGMAEGPSFEVGPPYQSKGLSDCVSLALESGADTLILEAERDMAVAQKKSARGHFGPKVKVDGGLQLWDSPFESNFSMDFMGFEIPKFKLRDTLTWNANIYVIQPLMQLWTIFEAHELRSLGVDVADLKAQQSRLDKAFMVIEAYYLAGLAEKAIGIHELSLQQSQNDLEQVASLVKAGVLVEKDKDMAALGLKHAELSLLKAKRQHALSLAHLSSLVGEKVRPKDGRPSVQDAPLISLEAAQKMALLERIEYKLLNKNIKLAEKGVQIAMSKMAPELNLVGAAQFNGGSEFMQDTSLFIGLTFDWMVWEWGAQKYGIDEARAQLAMVKANLSKLEEGVKLETENAWIDFRSSLDEVELAEEALSLAEIQYEFEGKRLQEGRSSTQDLLRAEKELKDARLTKEMVLSKSLIAKARLNKAMGQSVEQMIQEGSP